MKHTKILLISAAICFVFISCEKSNGDNGKTNTELVTQSSWKYDNASIDSDNNGTGDTPLPAGTVQDCQADNTLTLNANGSGTVDEGPSKCNAADPQTTPVTWNFSNNETVINFNTAIFAGVSGDFKIISLTETQLVLSKTLTIPPLPIPITVVATFKH